MNKLLIITFLCITFLTAGRIPEPKNLKDEIVQLMYEKIAILEEKVEEKISYCNNIEKRTILDPNLFVNLNVTNKQISNALAYFYFSAQNKCSENELNLLIVAYDRLLVFFEYHKMANTDKMKKIQHDRRVLFLSTVVLETELTYNENLNKKDKDYLNSLKELKKPFNFDIVLEFNDKQR